MYLIKRKRKKTFDCITGKEDKITNIKIDGTKSRHNDIKDILRPYVYSFLKH